MATITIDYEEYKEFLAQKEKIMRLETEKIQLAEEHDVLVCYTIRRTVSTEFDGLCSYESLPKDELFTRLSIELKSLQDNLATTSKELQRLKSRNFIQRLFNL